LTLADLTIRERELIGLCFHEAGHAVAGTALGGRVFTAAATQSRVNGPEGTTRFDDLSVGRHPVVALAGPFAQAKWEAWRAGAGRGPGRRELDAILAGGGRKDRAALLAAGTDVIDTLPETSKLIDTCWDSVVKVARRLWRDGEARREHVTAALGLSADPATAALQLAHIRAGSPPHSFTITTGTG
jgi:hypothetical protein